jgi:hypothetical protein
MKEKLIKYLDKLQNRQIQFLLDVLGSEDEDLSLCQARLDCLTEVIYELDKILREESK